MDQSRSNEGQAVESGGAPGPAAAAAATGGLVGDRAPGLLSAEDSDVRRSTSQIRARQVRRPQISRSVRPPRTVSRPESVSSARWMRADSSYAPAGNDTHKSIRVRFGSAATAPRTVSAAWTSAGDTAWRVVLPGWRRKVHAAGPTGATSPAHYSDQS